jgi:hypothetical protein
MAIRDGLHRSVENMKTTRYFPVILLATAALLLSCEQLTEDYEEMPVAPPASNVGTVVVRASVEGVEPAETGGAPVEDSGEPAGNAAIDQTITPEEPPDFTHYRLVFSRAGSADVVVDPADMSGSGVSRELKAGVWTAAVTAYRTLPATEEAPPEYYEAALGSKEITVKAGQTTKATLSLSPSPVEHDSLQGKFTYKVSFPDGASGTMTLTQTGQEPKTFQLTESMKSFTTIDLPHGDYYLAISLSNEAKNAAKNAARWDRVHIYDDTESKAEFVFGETDFSSTVYLWGTLSLPDGVNIKSGTVRAYSDAAYTMPIGQVEASADWVIGVPISSIKLANIYLAAVVSGKDGTTYIGTGESWHIPTLAAKKDLAISAYERVKNVAAVGIYFDAVPGGGDSFTPAHLPLEINLADDWTTLLGTIAAKEKYVALDLSACKMSGTEFDPGTDSGDNTGRGNIASLVLPDTASKVKAGSNGAATFKDFIALNSVSGSKVGTVGGYAFSNCTALTHVSFPKATSIDGNAFSGCALLNDVELPAAITIGASAFSGCTTLTSVELPAAVSIGASAFSDCSALTAVDLPAAKELQNNAFSGCTALTSVNLPAATTIGASAFSGCSALTSVNLPAATSIGGNAFQSCAKLANVYLGGAVPTLGTELFSGVNSPLTVNVRVPVSASAWDYNLGTWNASNSNLSWGNGFRGAGWNGSGAFIDSSKINANITVDIKKSQ